MTVATREQACLHAKAMMSILQTVSDVVQRVCNGWKTSCEEFGLQTVKVAVTVHANDKETSEG